MAGGGESISDSLNEFVKQIFLLLSKWSPETLADS